MFLPQRTIVRVGIDEAPPVPMQMGGPETGDFRGYEVSLLRMLASTLGFEIQYRRALWSVIIQELATGRLDLVCSAATITDARRREVDFCTPHLAIALAVVKRRGLPCHLQLNDLRVGVRSGTTAEAYLRQLGETRPAKFSESNEELYAALAEGKLDAVIDDSPIARHFSRTVAELVYVGVLPGTEGAYAIMVRQGNDELRTRINNALGQKEAEGTLTDLRDQWFHEDGVASLTKNRF
jgi:polar amino acid transport system substrate-binding protein